MDTNDSTGETSGWQDSADYDIGDAVPYKLTATLAENVTAYLKYYIEFIDEMENGLTFNEVSKVTLNGVETTDYQLTSTDHSFNVLLTWGDGITRITDITLNNALVEVFFTAILNENAILGSYGNVNKARLEFSNNPKVIDSKDSTDYDFVIAFTYKVEIDKTDDEGNALSGAEFKLEKVLVDGTRKEIASNVSLDGTTFTFKGLDDGNYVLTETETPVGYLPINPINFIVTADHEVLFEDMDNREMVLTTLTGDVITGDLKLDSDKTNGLISGDVENSPKTTKVTVVKVWDDNENRDGIRPESITIRLSNGDTVELNAENGWKATIDNLPMYDGTEPIIYTWTEDNLPKGYTLKDISVNGEITTITNTHRSTSILITKVDITTKEEVPGAVIQVLDSNGNKVDEWTSTTEAHIIQGLNTNEEYTIKEIIAPAGYTIATESTFIIDDEGNVTTSGTMTKDKDGRIILLVEDSKTKVAITKVDITTGEEVPGAVIQIIDSKGNIVDEWVSTTEAHVIEGLKVNETYTLKEIVAPEGYEITAETTFIIDEYGNITSTGPTAIDSKGNIVLLVQDKKISTPPSDNPNTADYYDLYIMLLKLFMIGFAGGVMYLRKYNQV